MRAMITVCGKYGDRYWVSDLLLIVVTALSQTLAKKGIDVVYADSVDNAQMSTVDGIGVEGSLALRHGVDMLFLVYRDEESVGTGKLLKRFHYLRSSLDPSIKLVLVDSFPSTPSLSREDQSILSKMSGVVFLDTSAENLIL